MNYLDEGAIRAGIANFQRQEMVRSLPQPRRQYIPGELWEEKFDRLYRELKPREQFGKMFDARFRRSNAA